MEKVVLELQLGRGESVSLVDIGGRAFLTKMKEDFRASTAEKYPLCSKNIKEAREAT